MTLINSTQLMLSYTADIIIKEENAMGCCGGCGGEAHEPVKSETQEQQEEAQKKKEEE